MQKKTNIGLIFCLSLSVGSLLFLLFCVTSCIVDSETISNKIQPPEIFLESGNIGVATYNQSVTIKLPNVRDCSDKMRYQWYESFDGSFTEACAIPDAIDTVFITPPLKEKCIRYFFCVMTTPDGLEANSEMTVVAYTGISALFIQTNDDADVTSKEIWLDATFSLITEKHDNLAGNLKIKGRGNTSWGFQKKPYSLKLSEKKKLLGLNKSKKWVLINNHIDKSLLRNAFASYLGTQIFNSHWNPSFDFVDLILNGKYRGTYLLGEFIEIDRRKINIPSLAESHDITDGGFICEINNKLDESYNFSTKAGIPIISLKDPDTTDFIVWDETLESYINGTVQQAEDALYGENWLSDNINYRKKIDANSFVDWYLVNDFLKNADAVGGPSIYFYYNPVDEKIHFGPNWDFDACCGQCSAIVYSENLYNYEGFWVFGGYKLLADGGHRSTLWINRLFSDVEFIRKVQSRWNENKENVYNAINTVIQNFADEINISAEMNFKLYPILGSLLLPDYAPPGYETRLAYQDEVDYLIAWLNNRYQWFDVAINAL